MFRRFLYLLIALVLLAAVGCGGKLNPFKELGVSKNDLPAYEVSSEISNSNPPSRLWATVEKKDIDENQAKQIIADYIDKKLIEHGNTLQGLYIIVKAKKEVYSGVYAVNEETFKALAPNAQKPQKYPTVVYLPK